MARGTHAILNGALPPIKLCYPYATKYDSLAMFTVRFLRGSYPDENLNLFRQFGNVILSFSERISLESSGDEEGIFVDQKND